MTKTAAKVTPYEFEELVRKTIPLCALFDFNVEAVEHGSARVRIRYSEKLIRAGGTVAGPILFTAADIALYAVTLSLIGLEPMAVTSQLDLHFLRKASAADLVAHGTVLRAGRSLVVGEVGIFSQDIAEPVAHAVGSYVVVRKK